MKKLLSISIAIIMMLSLCIPAFATTITIVDPENILADHTFIAYQILAGDYDESCKTLSNITWGNGVDGEDLIVDLKKDEFDSFFNNAFDGLDSTKVSCPSDLAAILSSGEDSKGNKLSNEAIEKFIDIVLTHVTPSHAITLDVKNGSELDYGYYLIVDSTSVDGKNDVSNATLLQVAGDDIEINAKVDKPPFYKKVQEMSDYTTDDGFGAGYNDVATYSIGDTVPFLLKSIVPNLAQYTEYEMSFHDKMSKGLTLDVDSITVTIGGVELEKGTTNNGVHTGDYHVSVTHIDVTNETADTPAGTTVFNIHIPDLKSIRVSDGQGGTKALDYGADIIVTYNATLNKNAAIGIPGNPNTAYLEYTNDPDSDSKGKTPEDKVIVFTLGIEIDKVDGANTDKKLKGVEFVLWKDNAKSAFAVVDSNKKFDSWVTVSSLTDANSDGVVDPYDYSSEVKNAILVSDADGNVTIAGLENGTYFIQETKELPGYNAIVELMPIVIDANVAYGQSWDLTPDSALKTSDKDKDSDNDWYYEIQILNYGGTVLPETGGLGTAIFVTIGCILIIGASVLMITRKKMSIYEN